MLKCKKCGNNTFHTEEMYSKNGLLEGVSQICTKCGEVIILPFKKEQEFRQELREKQDNKCFTCKKENPRTLHHRGSNPNNMALVCGKCHRKLNKIKDIMESAKPELRKEIIFYLKSLNLL